MTLNQFSIGLHFLLKDELWKCTDVGSRTISAIMIIDDRDPSYHIGPPYTAIEWVLNEENIAQCQTIKAIELSESSIEVEDLAEDINFDDISLESEEDLDNLDNLENIENIESENSEESDKQTESGHESEGDAKSIT